MTERELLVDEHAELAAITDPIARARRVGELIDQHQAAVVELSQLRVDLLEGLLAAGMTQVQIADALGLTRSRISRILKGDKRPEGAFIGHGRMLVAIGGQYETQRPDESTLAVVSAEAMTAYERLADLARSLGLTAEHEVVEPPGLVDLNRPNLVVLTSPKLLPLVGQIQEADPAHVFRRVEQRWYLLDRATGTEFRSPMDSGEPSDFAYIGRLPRPDGAGTFLYLAGVHSMGTLGAVQYLETHLPELYRELRQRRWSTILKCDFDPATRTITAVSVATRIARHEGA